MQKLLENGWLGDYFHFGKVNFSGAFLVSGRVSHQSGSGLWRITTPKQSYTLKLSAQHIWDEVIHSLSRFQINGSHMKLCSPDTAEIGM